MDDKRRTLEDVMFGESDEMLFTKPRDVHRETAAEIFGVRPEDVTEDMRKEAKRLNFGKLYGSSAETLQRMRPVTEAEAASMISRVFAKRPKCPRCWNKQPAKRSCGYCGGQGRV